MSSGYFPLERGSLKGLKLLGAVNTIEAVSKDMWKCVAELEDSGDASFDGACLAELELAKKLILGVLENQ